MMNKLFPRNERAIRIALGLGILSLVFVGPQTLWGLLGLVPLMTGLVGSCPMYTLLGINTCSIDHGGGDDVARVGSEGGGGA